MYFTVVEAAFHDVASSRPTLLIYCCAAVARERSVHAPLQEPPPHKWCSRNPHLERPELRNFSNASKRKSRREREGTSTTRGQACELAFNARTPQFYGTLSPRSSQKPKYPSYYVKNDSVVRIGTGGTFFKHTKTLRTSIEKNSCCGYNDLLKCRRGDDRSACNHARIAYMARPLPPFPLYPLLRQPNNHSSALRKRAIRGHSPRSADAFCDSLGNQQVQCDGAGSLRWGTSLEICFDGSQT